ncbi:DUF484 family protein [Vibrio gallicus]|uniref:DUF484 family protein n=1 Tax=Vibrio gallicus TaxID=190897 RepID=UPI0021C2C7B0|nr:DUF484 family protein [Vibrio gallicus]
MEQKISESEFNALLVEEFLVNNPDFFIGREALLDSLSLSHHEKGVISLVELKLQRQREQLKAVESEQEKLIKLLEHNDHTLRCFMEAEKRMLAADCGEQVYCALEACAKRLGLHATLGLQDHAHSAVNIGHQQWQLFQKQYLVDRGVYLGRLKRSDRELILGEKAAEFELGSLVVVPFDHSGVEGFLCFYSDDGGHFEPSQDTLYLSHLATVMAHQLSRLPWLKVQALHAESSS